MTKNKIAILFWLIGIVCFLISAVLLMFLGIEFALLFLMIGFTIGVIGEFINKNNNG